MSGPLRSLENAIARSIAVSEAYDDLAIVTLRMDEAVAIRAFLAGGGNRFFATDQSMGEFIESDTLGQAKADAQSLLDAASDDAAESGWADEPPQIYYGVILGGCVEESRGPAPEGSDFTEMVSYRLELPTEPVQRSAQAALAEFTAYFVQNYPGPNTIICDPKWHAPRIFRAAKRALSGGA